MLLVQGDDPQVVPGSGQWGAFEQVQGFPAEAAGGDAEIGVCALRHAQ